MTVPTAPTPLLFLDIFKNLTLQFIASFDFHSWWIVSFCILWVHQWQYFIYGNHVEGLLTGIVNHIQRLYLQWNMRCSFLGTAGEDAERTSSWYSLKAYEKTHAECLALTLADSKCPFSSRCPECFKAIAQWGRVRATPSFPRCEQTELTHSLRQVLISPQLDCSSENRP